MENKIKMEIQGITISIVKKKIKSINIRVKPPLGEVTVSAPVFVTESDIVKFVENNIEWIKENIEKVKKESENDILEYRSGEKIAILGKVYTLCINNNRWKDSFIIEDMILTLNFKGEPDYSYKEKFMTNVYRSILTQKLEEYVEYYEKLTGLKSSSWHTKVMKTRWGTCNTNKKRLWFNVELAKKEEKCIQYVVLHEIIHIKVPNHGKDFIGLMDYYMPDWRQRKEILNSNNLLKNS